MSSAWTSLRVIDGGLGMYAEQQCGVQVDGHPLWTGRLVHDDPELVKRIHTEFLDAGADIIETISYQLSLDKIREVNGASVAEAESVMADSVRLAREAVTEAWPRLESHGRPRPLVAACIGPYGATLCDKSEYTGRYVDVVTTDFLTTWHRPRIAALLRQEPDLLAVDSIPAVAEAEAILRVLREFPNVPAWLSFSTLDGAHTCHGESLTTASQKIKGLLGLGVNCCPPDVVSDALKLLRGRSDQMMVAFPNNGAKFDAASKTFHPPAASVRIPDYVEEWISLGCRWIGGCCGCGSEDIASVAMKIKEIRKLEANRVSSALSE